MNSYSSRRVCGLLVILLLLAQVGGWLHELSHHGAIASETRVSAVLTPGDSLPTSHDESTDHQCLRCLVIAALTLALSGTVLLLLPPLQFALPIGVVPVAKTFRWRTHPARGPPRVLLKH